MISTTLRVTAFVVMGVLIGGSTRPIASVQNKSGSNIETVVTFDSSGPTENICQKADGSIFVTGIDDRVIWKIAPNSTTPLKFASLSSVANVIGIAPTADAVLVTAAERPFRRPGQSPAADFSDVGPEVIVLDPVGQVRKTIPGQKGSFFNGVTPAGDGTYLIADTGAASVWRLDLKQGRIELWFTDPLIEGANGIKVHNGWVYLSSRAGLQKIQIDRGRPKGTPMLLEAEVRPDDFDITNDGTIYFPRGTTLYKVSPTGELTRFRENIQDGPAALVGAGGSWLYWPTRGGNAPQKLLRTAIP